MEPRTTDEAARLERVDVVVEIVDDVVVEFKRKRRGSGRLRTHALFIDAVGSLSRALHDIV